MAFTEATVRLTKASRNLNDSHSSEEFKPGTPKIEVKIITTQQIFSSRNKQTYLENTITDMLRNVLKNTEAVKCAVNNQWVLR